MEDFRISDFHHSVALQLQCSSRIFWFRVTRCRTSCEGTCDLWRLVKWAMVTDCFGIEYRGHSATMKAMKGGIECQTFQKCIENHE